MKYTKNFFLAVRCKREVPFMKVKNNMFDKLIEIICLIFAIGVPIYIIINWANIPDPLPMHYDFAGNVDRWGDKAELIILPIVTLIMYGFMTLIERFPQVWNTGVTVTEENQERVYRTLKYLVKTLKLIVVIDFSYMTINTLMCQDLPIWFTPVLLLIVFGDLIFWIIRLVKVK